MCAQRSQEFNRIVESYWPHPLTGGGQLSIPFVLYRERGVSSTEDLRVLVYTQDHTPVAVIIGRRDTSSSEHVDYNHRHDAATAANIGRHHCSSDL